MNALRSSAVTSNPVYVTEVLPSTETAVGTNYATDQAVQKIISFMSVEDNWNGYGGLKPRQDAIQAAIYFCYSFFDSGTPVPDIFPVPNGNIQIEWSCCNRDIEIEFESLSKYFAAYENLDNGEVWEREFKYDLTIITGAVKELSNLYISSNLQLAV